MIDKMIDNDTRQDRETVEDMDDLINQNPLAAPWTPK